MGGSCSAGEYGGGTSSNNCGGSYEFRVVVNGSEEQIKEVWERNEEGNDVEVVLINDNLPRLEVKRINDGFIIGYVPPSLSKFINCINEGWKYVGKITRISGNIYQPEIYVQIEGALNGFI